MRTEPKYRLFLTLSFFLFLFFSVNGQRLNVNPVYQDSLRILFYNVENLFDPFDDSLTIDEEFTSEGERHWTWNKFQTKLSHIYKTILSAGNPLPPAIIGLCEVENRFVLNQLVYKTPFSKMDYRIVHEESPDRRGIDVALLFDPGRATLLAHEAIPIHFPFAPDSKTRDILYSKLLVFKEDTIHVFVNHWPSRWGGQMATAPKRNYVASVLKLKTDSILKLNPNAHILIMGDFNDEPEDESIQTYLQAKRSSDSTSLVNLMLSLSNSKTFGSHKYQENWGILDQIIVSKSLLLPHNPIKIKNSTAQIFNASFLMEEDMKFMGEKPYRTFVGFKYNGGFSDHLPVFVDVCK
jgi:predicted extracellular nuclease